MQTQDIKIDESFIDKLLEVFPKADLEDFCFSENLEKYQSDPVGFIEKYFNVFLPDKLKEICESVRDNRITIAQSCTGFGKTFIAGLLAIWAYKCFPESIVNCLASPPERNLKEKLLGEVRSQMRTNKKLFSKDNITTLKISDDNNESGEDSSKTHAILGISIPSSGDDEQKQSRISGSHAPYQFFFLDEVDGIHDAVIKAIEGCMSGNFERQLGMFNPKSKSGEIYRKIKNGKANVIKLSAFDHPNVITGKDIVPGAVSRAVTIRRINDWTKPLAPGEEPNPNTCFEVPDFLVGTTTEDDSGKEYKPLESGWRRIEDHAFSFMVLGEYPAQGENQLFSTEWIDRAFSNYQLYVSKYGEVPPEGIRPINGMDVSDMGGDMNTVCSRYGNFIPPIKSWKGVDIPISAQKAAEIHAETDALVTNVESDGLGAAVGPLINNQHYWKCESCGFTTINDIDNCVKCKSQLKKQYCNAKKVYVGSSPTKKCEFGEFDLLRSQLAWSAREFLRTNENAMVAPDLDLKEEMEAISYEVDKKVSITKKKMLRKILGRSPDKFDSFVQTFYESPIPKIRMV